MDLDALLQTLLKAVGNNPTMVLILTLAFFFLKRLFPAPAPASTQVMQGYAERIRLALLAGNKEGAKELAEESVEKARGYVLAEAEPKPKGFLDIFTGLLTGGNLMPLLMIGGIVALLMLTQGNGCQKASGGVLAPHATTFQLLPTEPSLYVRPAIFRHTDCVDPTLCAAGPFEWAEPLAEPGDADSQGISGVDRRGKFGANAGVGGLVAVCGAAGCSDGTRAPLASRRSTRYRVGWIAGPRARPVARAAGFVYRPVARAAVGLVRVVRWVRPLRRAAAAICWRRR